jgi:hypothetical protein
LDFSISLAMGIFSQITLAIITIITWRVLGSNQSFTAKLIPFAAIAWFYWRRIVHAILFTAYYHFGDAYPTTDKRPDSRIENSRGGWQRALRSFENTLYDGWIARHDSYAKCGFLALPELNTTQATLQNFHLVTGDKRRPTVIRGFLQQSPAFRKWSPEYFAQHYGDAQVLTIQAPRDNRQREEEFTAYTSFHQRLIPKRWNLADCLAVMRNPQADTRPYINNATELFTEYPELVSELDLNRLRKIDRGIDEDQWLKINLFMGGPKTGSSLHCAVAGNFFFNIYGRKRWVLIDPAHTALMRATPARDFSFVISGHDLESAAGQHFLDVVPKYEVILEPGDLLYVPPWWWHYVKNESDFTIACAVRDHTPYEQSWELNPLFMALSPYWYRLHPWTLALIEGWKGHDGMVAQSMTSGKDIVGHLAGQKIE